MRANTYGVRRSSGGEAQKQEWSANALRAINLVAATEQRIRMISFVDKAKEGISGKAFPNDSNGERESCTASNLPSKGGRRSKAGLNKNAENKVHPTEKINKTNVRPEEKRG